MKKNTVHFCGFRNLMKKNFWKISFQVINLILYTFAFSYFFAVIDERIEIATAQENSGGTLSIPESNSLDFQLNCCKETRKGSNCEDMASSLCKDDCSTGCIQTTCNNVAECKLGFCYDTRQGTCPANVPKARCEEEGGKWFDARGGQPDVCKNGCCVLGANAQFTTETQCKRLSDASGLSKDFRPGIITEVSCIALAYEEETGACVNEVNFEMRCIMGSRQECNSRGGQFYKNVLCTSDRLQEGGICKKTERTTCLQGKDGVYFLDSCGNTANIYDSSRLNDPDYWDIIIPVEQSCGSDGKNANSKSCGNCNYFSGNICGAAKDIKPAKGDYICRDINCQYEGRTVKNGESWCIYDGDIGDGVDLVGSRYWRRMCSMGEIKVEPCDDYRNYLCVQENIKISDADSFSSSKCRVNMWQMCNSYNLLEDKDELEKKCNENSDCTLQKINIDDGFKYSLCVPAYPPGFDLTSDDRAKSAQQICAMGSNKCTVIYEKKFSGWTCVQNCDCEKTEFTEKMNKLCTSLGDCGLKRNIAGDIDEGYAVDGATRLSKDNAVGSLTLPQGKHAEPGDYLKTVNETSYQSDANDLAKNVNLLSMSSLVGATGVLALIAASALINVGAPVSLSNIGALLSGEIVQGATYETAMPGFTVVSNFAIAGAVSAATAFILTKLFGLNGDAALAMSIAGATVGLLTATIFYAAGSSCLVMPVFCLGIIVVAMLVMAILLKVFKIGQTRKETATFTCLPWEAPTGGDKCSLCNQDPLKPCSKYRCESLGQACQFINEGTKREVCVSVAANDAAAPFISPDESVLSPGYKYSDVSQAGFRLTKKDGSCIDSFTPLIFGMNTNEPAQCKIDIQHTQNMDAMMGFFAGNNLYLYNHTMPLYMPSNDALKSQILDGINISELSDSDKELINTLDEKLKGVMGDINFYVRCKDYNGNGKDSAEFAIKTCINPGPDKTPPAITNANPESGSFVGVNKTTQNISILVNEPVECRWSRADKDYDLMENSFSCDNSLSDATPYGWKCNTDLTGLNIGENRFYLRCEDKPFAGDETSRNPNTQSYSYILNRVKNKLIIIKALPKEDIISGKLFNTVNLEVETLQGAENGKATCFWNYNNGAYVLMLKTDSNIHTQELTDRSAGYYPIGIRCTDSAGDIAEASLNFSIRIDAFPPTITRAYKFGDELKIYTNEPGECKYSFTGCNFDFGTASGFTDNGIEHTASWKNDVTYYIVCSDRWGNLPSDCSIRLKGYKIR